MRRIRFIYAPVALVAVALLGPTPARAANPVPVSSCTEAALRSAIATAGFGGSVRFECDGTIQLSATLVLAQSVTIEAERRDVILSGGDARRVVTIDPGAKVSLTGLTVTRGRAAQGAGIYVSPTAALTLKRSTVTANTAVGASGQAGGAVTDGAAGADGRDWDYIPCAVFSDTSKCATDGVAGASGRSGGAGTAGAAALGGGVYSAGTLTVVESEITANRARGGDGGRGGAGGDGGAGGTGGDSFHEDWWSGAVYGPQTTGGDGGDGGDGGSGGTGGAARGAGLYVTASVSVLRSLIADNAAVGGRGGGAGDAGAGAVAGVGGWGDCDYCTWHDESPGPWGIGGDGGNSRGGAGGDADGAGVTLAGGKATLANTTVAQNTTAGGPGGAGGRGGDGGAGWNADFHETDDPDNYDLRGGSGGDSGGGDGGDANGGALAGAGAVLTNTTVARNGATAGAAGAGGLQGAGGQWRQKPIKTATGVWSVSGWSPDGISFTGTAGTATGGNLGAAAEARNSIVAVPTGGASCAAALQDRGTNLQYPGSSCGLGIRSAAPGLDAELLTNGGPTRTLALLDGSPAIRAGSTAACGISPVAGVDQRGLARQASACDIGAFDTYGSRFVTGTTTTVVSSADTAVRAGATVTFTATVRAAAGTTAPSGRVSFRLDGVPQAVRTLSAGAAGTATAAVSLALPTGRHSITAVYDGAETFAPSRDSVAQNAGAQSVIGLTLRAANPSSFGQPIEFDIYLDGSVVDIGGGRLRKPGGTLIIYDGDQPIGTVFISALTTAPKTATFTTSTLPAGRHQIRIVYPGSSNHAGSESEFSITVNPATSQTTLTASPAYVGDGYTLTAQVSGGGPKTGTVIFQDDRGVLATQAVTSAGRATVNVSAPAAGTRTFIAKYTGDPNHRSSASTPLTVTIVPAATTTTTITANTASSLAGDEITLDATLTASTGTATGSVEFYDETVRLGTAPLTAGHATLDVSLAEPGTHRFRAVYRGATGYSASETTALEHLVLQPTTLDLGCQPLFAAPGEVISCVARVTDTSGARVPAGSVSFDAPVGLVAAGQCTLQDSACEATLTLQAGRVGDVQITASYTGQEAHAPSSDIFKVTTTPLFP